MSFSLRVRILGCGTSTGVPIIGCSCRVCQSIEPKNARLRSSLLVEIQSPALRFVIDTTPEFRIQMLRERVSQLDGVFMTHTHADHCHGFDDLRAFYFWHPRAMPVYMSHGHAQDFQRRFPYLFQKTGYLGTVASVALHTLSQEAFQVEGVTIEHAELPHGSTVSTAYRIGSFAYATDFQYVPEAVIERWKGKIHTMVASGLRFHPHPTHSSIPETIELFRRLGVKRGILSHLTHDVDYVRDSVGLPSGVELAYDGMVLDVLPLIGGAIA